MKYTYYNLQVVTKNKNFETVNVGNFESPADAEIVKFAYFMQGQIENFSLVGASISLKRSENIPSKFYSDLDEFIKANKKMENAIKLVRYDNEHSM